MYRVSVKHKWMICIGIVVALATVIGIWLLDPIKGITSPQVGPHKSDRVTDIPTQPQARSDTESAQSPASFKRSLNPTRDPELAALVDRKTLSPRVTGNMTERLPMIRFEEDVPKVVAVVQDPEDDDTIRHESIELLRRSGYPDLTNLVLGVLDNPREQPRFRAFCVQHLWINSQTASAEEIGKITSVLYRSLNDRDLPVRREALLALVHMGDPLGQETAVKWLLDDNAKGTRDLAIRCIHDLNMKEYIPTIRKYLYDPDEVIRIAAIVALSQWDDEESRPAFSAAAKSDSIRVQRAGQAALTRLSQPAKTP